MIKVEVDKAKNVGSSNEGMRVALKGHDTHQEYPCTHSMLVSFYELHAQPYTKESPFDETTSKEVLKYI